MVRAGYIDKKNSFKESSANGHERLKEIAVLSTGSEVAGNLGQGLENYDDVAEDEAKYFFKM